MKAFSNQPMTDDYFQQFCVVINNQDDYWAAQNNHQLPKGIQALKKAVNGKNASLTTLIAATQSWSVPALMYQPEPCLQSLYQMILAAEQDAKRVNESLRMLRNVQRQYAELKTKLEANQTALAEAMSSKDAAMQAKAYKERGLLYLDTDKTRYSHQAFECFTQAIALKSDPAVSAFCLCKRASFYLAEGQVELGINDFSEACRLVADNPQAWFEYGEALVSLQRCEEAVEPLKKALTLKPDSYKIQTLLKDAMQKGKLSLDAVQNIQALLAVGHTLADLSARAQERQELPLWLKAAQLGDCALMEYLASILDTQVQDEAGNTALHYAARFGHVHLLELLRRYLNLNAPNREGLTSLLIAVREGKTAMAEALINAGANPAGALLMAIETGQGCVFEALYRLQLPSNHMDLLRKAIESKQLPMLRMLLAYYPDALNTLYQGETLLHYAIRTQFVEGVQYLIDNSADLEIRCGQKTMDTLAAEFAPSCQAAISNARLKRQHLEKQRAELEQTLLQSLQANFPLLKDNDNQRDFLQVLNEVLSGTMLNEQFNRFLVEHLIRYKAQIIESRTIRTDKFKIDALKQTLNTLMDAWRQPQPVPVTERPSLPPVSGLTQVSAVFCERFEKQLDEAYGYFRAVASGELISAKDQQLLQQGQNLARVLPNATVQGVTIPVSSLALGALELAGYLRQYYCRQQAERMVHVFKAVTPYERTHFIRYTAEQLADKYHDQINHLMPSSEGVELFADCAAARVIEYIASSEKHQIAYEPSALSNLVRSVKSWATGKEIPPEQREQKNLYQLFVDGIVRVSSQFPKEKERLKTINHLTLEDNWSTKGIFENTGIVTPGRQRYAHPNVDIERYGYCKGTAEEANRRDLTLKSKKEVSWGAGRVWEVAEDNQRLEPLPGRPLLAGFEGNAEASRRTSSPEGKRGLRLQVT